jgi:hypothetical protein
MFESPPISRYCRKSPEEAYDNACLGSSRKDVGDSVSSDETYNAKLRDTFVDRQSYWQEWTSQDPTLFEEEDRTSSNMLNTHNQEREKEREIEREIQLSPHTHSLFFL